MKKVEKSLGERLEPVRVYLDDLEQIIDALRQVSTRITIHTEDYELDELDELTKLKREYIHQLRLAAHDPFVSVDIAPSHVWLYTATDRPIARGVFHQIKEILEARALAKIDIGAISGVFVVLSIVSYVVLRFADADGTKLVAALSFLGSGAAFLVVLMLGYLQDQRRHSTIVPNYCIDAPSFWKRNADNIVVAILSALAATVITLLLTKMFGAAP